MTVEAINWAFKQDLAPAMKVILLALADYADGDGFAYPGQQSLSEKTSIPERSLRRHLAKLEELGLITRERRKRDDGLRTSDGYWLQMSPAKMAANVTGQNEGGYRPTVAGTYRNEPPVEPPVVITRARSGTDVVPSAAAWTRFWDEYPRKVGKPQALKAWGAALARGHTPEKILLGLRAHQEAFAATDPQFIPHPSTFLNQDRFNDQPTLPRQFPDRRAGRDIDQEIRNTLTQSLGLDEIVLHPVDDHRKEIEA